MTEVYFNDNNQSKYDFAFYICQQNHNIMIFDNSIELRDHVLDYHDVNTRFVELKYRNNETKYIQHAKKHVYNFASSFFMSYAMIKVSIFDFELTFCLNTDENVFLCDRSLLSQNRNHYDLVHRTKFITIIEIANMQMLNQYIEQKILLSLKKIFVLVKVYIINDLQSNLIIDMNVLNKDDIDLLLNRQVLRIKNVEISLFYTSLSDNENNNEINYKTKNQKHDYYFYHFVIDQSNRNDIIRLSIKKWRFVVQLISIKKNAHFKNECQSTEFDDLTSSKISNNDSVKFFKCRRCKQIFISRNLLHNHLQHCKKDIKKSKQTRKLDESWRRSWKKSWSMINTVVVLIINCKTHNHKFLFVFLIFAK